VVESADLRHLDDIAMLGWLEGAWLGSILLECEMRTRLAVIAEVTPETTTKVSLVEDDDVVEELASDGADHALGEGVLPRRSRRGEKLGGSDVSLAKTRCERRRPHDCSLKDSSRQGIAEERRPTGRAQGSPV